MDGKNTFVGFVTKVLNRKQPLVQVKKLEGRKGVESRLIDSYGYEAPKAVEDRF